MAATQTRSTQSADGSAASKTAATVKNARGSVATAARKAKVPALAVGTAAAGLAGGLALGARRSPKRSGVASLFAPRRKVLGVPIERKNSMQKTAEALGDVARELTSATAQVSHTADDVRELRGQLDKVNRRSPLEVVLDGLTHRRGAHKLES
jgi:hypothetical protein